MDIRIKKYIQYKIKTLNERRRELYKLKQERETLRQEIIDESPAPQDGQPKGKGGSSSPVETKVIKLEKIDKRIGVLDGELKKFQEIEDKIKILGREPYLIYKLGIVEDANQEYAAMEVGMAIAPYYRAKAKLLEYIAEELGEYLNLDEESKATY